MIPVPSPPDGGFAPVAVVAAVDGKGRGVRAAVAIPEGQVIEVAPTVPLSAEDCERLEATALGDYYFGHPENDQEGVFVLGLASMVNHAWDPNTDTEWHFDPILGWQAVLRARRPIAPGEEITRRYRCPPWFETSS